MNYENLEATVKKILTPGKGLLAADESSPSCQKRFDAVGVPCTKETRAEYRGLMFTTPDIEDLMSGVILYDETFWQSSGRGHVFRDYMKTHDVLPGIKVDKGLVDLPGFPGEKVTQGLDGLPEQMQTYAGAGAKFAKWRAVITISDGDPVTPTDEAIGANTLALARYARICQDAGIVPLVEPEVLFDGRHSIERAEEVIAHVYDVLFQTLRAFRVHLPGVILKTSMVLPGKDSGVAINHDDVADRTARVLREHVPSELGGVVFLSGGQTTRDAFINLNRIVKRGPYPWGLTFSYSRAIQDPVLKAWAANRKDVEGVQSVFYRQMQLAAQASKGELDENALGRDSFVTSGQDL